MNRHFIVLAICISLCLALLGCQKVTNKSAPVATSAAVATRSPMETITIYSINSDTMSLIPVSVRKISNKNSLEYICSLVVENMDEQDVLVTGCQKDGKNAIVSFADEKQPIKECSAQMEQLILDAFANSILDNVNDCTGVIFRCDGDAYKSENLSFERNEMYASD